ncbi:hypothetical protein OKW96_09705 [Sphingobacterium sp. KU25419]|nr:hypothetical protein OKW96_09705 [Sphingobacterium sp. KU25419]
MFGNEIGIDLILEQRWKYAHTDRIGKSPANKVDPYAISTVVSNSFPAVFPSWAIDGIINPTIINGIKNFKNWSKRKLYVVNMRPSDSGR